MILKNYISKTFFVAIAIIFTSACNKEKEGSIYLEIETSSPNCYRVDYFKCSIDNSLVYQYPGSSSSRFQFDKYYRVVAGPGTYTFEYKVYNSCIDSMINFSGEIKLDAEFGKGKETPKSTYYDLGIGYKGWNLEKHK
jgi:hypothetical protein